VIHECVRLLWVCQQIYLERARQTVLLTALGMVLQRVQRKVLPKVQRKVLLKARRMVPRTVQPLERALQKAQATVQPMAQLTVQVRLSVLP